MAPGEREDSGPPDGDAHATGREQRSEDERDSEEGYRERRNRELIELLNELRVVLPGVQVLFAFLLTVPFSNGYTRMTALQRHVYFIALLSTAISVVLLIAPSTYHRITFRHGDKERLLLAANRYAISGTAFLAIATASALYVICDVLFGAAPAAIVGGLALLAMVFVWYAIPVRRLLRDRREEREHGGERRRRGERG
jgi:uncharacterized protein DUF6328